MLGLSCSMWDLVPDQGSNPLHWERGVLTTGPPGKPLPSILTLAFLLISASFRCILNNQLLYKDKDVASSKDVLPKDGISQNQ